MLVFKPCEKFLPLLLPPKIFTTTTNSKPHLHHHHHDVKLHFSPPKAHFKSTLSSSSSSSSSSSTLSPSSSSTLSPPPQPSDSLPPAADSSSASPSLTVDFLMDSGGLSYEEAMQVIQKMPTLLRKGGRKPRLVIAYFVSIGFSKTHISKLISKSPRVLVSDVEKTLKPKIQLFIDFGFSKSDIADLMSSNPTLLRTGVKTQMKPSLELIKSFVKTDEELIKIIKHNGYLLLVSNIRRNSIEPNIHVLRQHGVPDSEIMHFILSRLSILMSTPKVFKSMVERIVSLGFKPETRKFSSAVATMCGMKKATWDSKLDLLEGLGWSQVQILDTFRRNPRYLTLSSEKMKESVEFFKERLNWDVSVVSQYPFILNFSLKRRVIPRYAVLECLMSKEIIKEDILFKRMVSLNETKFLSKYVFKYQEQLPHLYEVYKKECMLGCEKDNGLIFNQQDHGDVDVTV